MKALKHPSLPDTFVHTEDDGVDAWVEQGWLVVDEPAADEAPEPAPDTRAGETPLIKEH